MKSFVRVHGHPRVNSCANILRHKTFLPHPDWFKMHGIPLVKIVQKPGEYIVTFPKGYHFGVNLGFCINEAVNVAIPSWINWGKVASPKCSCPEELVIFMHFFRSCDEFNQLLYKYFFSFVTATRSITRAAAESPWCPLSASSSLTGSRSG